MTTALQVSLYSLVMLSSATLAYAEGNSFPDAFTIPVAVLALFLTDRWKLFWLSVRWANGLGLLAFLLAAWELSSGRIEARLLALAHLLVYLTWIVLLMAKTARTYWILCTMSILHIAVGAPQTSSGAFGALCVVFFIVAIWTLTLFTLSRARQHYIDADDVVIRRPELDGAGPLSKDAESQSAALFLWNQPSRSVKTVQLDSRWQWVNARLVAGVVSNVLWSLVVGAIFFVFTPRIWVGNFSAFGESPDQPLRILQSGFAEEVQLGDIGQILEGTQTVLEVRMFDQETNRPVDVVELATQLGFDEPLFRGSVLGEYANGKWRVGTTGRNDGRSLLPQSPGNSGRIRQEFRLQPMDSGIVFAMPQHVAGFLDHRLTLLSERRLTSVLYRDDSISSREQLKYTIYSEKPRGRTNSPFPRGTHISQMYQSEIGYYRRLPERGLERLQALARQIAQADDAAPPAPNLAAQRLVQHLRDSGEYGYTLDLAVQDPRIDAVEDFLFNRKRGHCEYFASALALMLRAVGIPARLVSGFKGGDWNASTGYFVVQGRHAHVWVEALLDGRWRVLDATPASRSDSVRALAPKISLIGQIANFFSDLWSHQIVGLSFSEQSDGYYTPLRKWAAASWASLQQTLDKLRGSDDGLENSVSATSVLIVGVLVVLGFAMLFVLVGSIVSKRWRDAWWSWMNRFLRWLAPVDADDEAGDDRRWRVRWRRWWSSFLRRLSRSSDPTRRPVEFYERMLRLFRTAGLRPLPAQTAREFVLETQPAWSARLNNGHLSRVPNELVAQFYRVRFGGESLSDDELRRLDGQLAELESVWNSHAKTHERKSVG